MNSPRRPALSLALGLALLTSCAAVDRVVHGPTEALVTIPTAHAGQAEQHIVEASISRPCQAAVRAVQEGNWELAITAYRQALLEDDEDDNAHFGLGIAYEMTGRHAEALKEFELAQKFADGPNASYSMSIERIKAKLQR
jgi:Flp pilus assembly protein TadD